MNITMMFSTTSICHKFNGICSCIASEEKKRDDYICYCPDEDILGLGDRGLVKSLLRLMRLKRGDDFPGLGSILRQLCIPTVPDQA